MSDKYIPISCSYHDILESIAVMNEQCDIVFVDEKNQKHSIKARISDIFAKSGEEYLRLENGSLIRLDRLRLVNEIWFGPGSC
jgi:Rho-binding antiterminator